MLFKILLLTLLVGTQLGRCGGCSPESYVKSNGECGRCFPGYFCDGNVQIPCPKFTYCPDRGMTVPLPCPGGKLCPREGMKKPDDCQEKRFDGKVGERTVKLNSSPDLHVARGWYCPDVNMTKPLDCGEGYYCPMNSQSQKLCPLGSFCPGKTREPVGCDIHKDDDGWDCPNVGMTKPNVAVVPVVCTDPPCPVEDQQPDVLDQQPDVLDQQPDVLDQQPDVLDQQPDVLEDHLPINCGPGYYCPLNSEYQKICDFGHYCPGGTRNPIRCEIFKDVKGKHCSERNLHSPKPCRNGFYCDKGVQKECKEGHFCDKCGIDATQLGEQECEEGYYCPPGSVNMKPCGVGYYCPRKKMSGPEICKPGYFCDESNLKEMKMCQIGDFCPFEGMSKPIPCRFSKDDGLTNCTVRSFQSFKENVEIGSLNMWGKAVAVFQYLCESKETVITLVKIFIVTCLMCLSLVFLFHVVKDLQGPCSCASFARTLFLLGVLVFSFFVSIVVVHVVYIDLKNGPLVQLKPSLVTTNYEIKGDAALNLNIIMKLDFVLPGMDGSFESDRYRLVVNPLGEDNNAFFETKRIGLPTVDSGETVSLKFNLTASPGTFGSHFENLKQFIKIGFEWTEENDDPLYFVPTKMMELDLYDFTKEYFRGYFKKMESKEKPFNIVIIGPMGSGKTLLTHSFISTFITGSRPSVSSDTGKSQFGEHLTNHVRSFPLGKSKMLNVFDTWGILGVEGERMKRHQGFITMLIHGTKFLGREHFENNPEFEYEKDENLAADAVIYLTTNEHHIDSKMNDLAYFTKDILGKNKNPKIFIYAVRTDSCETLEETKSIADNSPVDSNFFFRVDSYFQKTKKTFEIGKQSLVIVDTILSNADAGAYRFDEKWAESNFHLFNGPNVHFLDRNSGKFIAKIQGLETGKMEKKMIFAALGNIVDHFDFTIDGMIFLVFFIILLFSLNVFLWISKEPASILEGELGNELEVVSIERHYEIPMDALELRRQVKWHSERLGEPRPAPKRAQGIRIIKPPVEQSEVVVSIVEEVKRENPSKMRLETIGEVEESPNKEKIVALQFLDLSGARHSGNLIGEDVEKVVSTLKQSCCYEVDLTPVQQKKTFIVNKIEEVEEIPGIPRISKEKTSFDQFHKLIQAGRGTERINTVGIVTRIGKLRTSVDQQGKKIDRQDVFITDSSKIQAKFTFANVNALQHGLILGDVVHLTNCTLSLDKRDGSIVVKFTKESTVYVNVAADVTALNRPTMISNFSQLKEVASSGKGKLINLVGVVTRIGDLLNVQDKGPTRDISICDPRKQEVQFTLWNDNALKSQLKVDDVVHLTNCTLGVKRNSLNLTPQTILFVNPRELTEEINALKLRAHGKPGALSMFFLEGGKLFGVGNNEYFQLGQGDKENRTEPVEVKIPGNPKIIAFKNGVASVATVVLTEDGLFGCGKGDLGTFGDSLRENRPTMKRIKEFGKDVEKYFCESEGLWVVLKNGKILRCGWNSCGQLATGTTECTICTPQELDTDFLRFPGENVVDIKSHEHSLLLTDKGNVFATGYGGSGRRGMGESDTGWKTKFEKNTFLAGKIRCIAVGFSYSMFVDADGVVFSCGEGKHGATGHNNVVDRYVPSQILALKNETIRKVVCGSEHTIFLTAQKAVYGCGNNSSSQIGLKTGGKPVLLPTRISTLDGIKDVVATFASTTFFEESGDSYSVGNNQYGQCCVGELTSPLTALTKTTIPMRDGLEKTEKTEKKDVEEEFKSLSISNIPMDFDKAKLVQLLEECGKFINEGFFVTTNDANKQSQRCVIRFERIDECKEAFKRVLDNEFQVEYCKEEDSSGQRL